LIGQGGDRKVGELLKIKSSDRSVKGSLRDRGEEVAF